MLPLFRFLGVIIPHSESLHQNCAAAEGVIFPGVVYKTFMVLSKFCSNCLLFYTRRQEAIHNLSFLSLSLSKQPPRPYGRGGLRVGTPSRDRQKKIRPPSGILPAGRV